MAPRSQRRRRRRPALALGALLLLAAPAAAEAPLFVWADKAGALHVTDRLGDVPEPWHSSYEERLRRLQAAGHDLRPSAPEPAAAAAPPPPVPPAATQWPTAAEEAARRRAWKELVARWRHELLQATGALQAAEADQAAAAQNPLLRLTPRVKEQVAALEAPRQAARARLAQAQHMLSEVIPARARAEHVPPAWIL